MSDKHTQGLLTVRLVDSWPFGVDVLDQNGEVMLHARAPCHSTEQQTRADHEQGVGFKINDRPGWKRADAVSAVECQVLFYRRLVACWNVCEGIPTDLLEAPDTDSQAIARKAWSHYQQVLDTSDALRAQRDELLAALERARPHLCVGYSAIQRHEITKAVDSAIAKVKGGAA